MAATTFTCNLPDNKGLKGYERRLYKEILATLDEFFKGDRDKVMLWLNTPNPALGGLTPGNMMLIGRVKKLHGFVMDSIEGNRP